MWFTAAAYLQLTELRLEVKLEKVVYVMVSTHLMYRESLNEQLAAQDWAAQLEDCSLGQTVLHALHSLHEICLRCPTKESTTKL